MNKQIPILPGEYWWGGTTISKLCPITQTSEYRQDFTEVALNQTSPFFLSSLGRYIWSDEGFKVDVSNGVFTLEGPAPIELECAGTTLRDAYLAASRKHFPCDGKPLESRFFTVPQYNTWIEFTYYPTQEGVLRYAHDIIGHGFQPGILIIDEGWHAHTGYGHWDFDRSRFPDPKAMVDEIHALGFTLMLWIVPYVTPAGPRYVRSLRPLVGTDPESAKHLYRRTETGEVAMVQWWNGVSALLDFTDEYNRKFLDDQLQYLMREYGVDGFKFDGGSLGSYSDISVINGKFEKSHTAAEHNRAWNEFGRRYPFHEYKDTFMGGGRNAVQRLHDRDHRWEGNGIDDIIPCAIVCGLIGHPFVCPDMVGGEWTNRYTPGFSVDEELFVRMAQASALFPMIQFSWAPWEALSEDNMKLCREAADLHIAMSCEMQKLVDEATRTGEPILRPLEYNDPHQGFEAVDDEYMIGEDILVAPVIHKGMRTREVAFPTGIWADETGARYEGPCRMPLDAPLEKLLWFRKEK